MKKNIYTTFILTLFAINLTAQESDSLIQLYPGLGDTLDSFDASYFELFQNIDSLEQAVFYIRKNQRLLSKVKYTENGKTKDTTFIQPLSALDKVREKIAEIQKENEKKYESPREFIIETKNGTNYLCEIKMFNKTMIYCSTVNNSNFKIAHSNIERLTLVGETNTWSCMGYGALIGLGFGLIGAILGSQSKGGGIGAGAGFIIGIPLVTIISGIAGLIVGLVTSGSDEEFIIDYQTDLIQLKPFVKYYFKYNESLEEQYVEVD